MRIINKIKNRTYRLLRNTQKYTGTDNVYLAKGGFWLTSGQVVSMAASFLLAIAFANLLTPATYGNYKYTVSLFGMLEIFSLIGMNVAVEQAVARNLEGSFYAAFKTKLKWALLGSLIAIGGAVYYWLRGNEVLSIPLLISAIFLPLMNASRVYVSLLAGRRLFNLQARYYIITQITVAVAIVATLFLTKNLFWLIAVYLIFHTFLNYFFYLFIKLKLRPNKNEDPQTISYGKHITLMAVINMIASYLDKILLFNLAGAAQLAIYSFATLIPEQISGATGYINDLALPKLAQRSHEEIKANIMKKFWKLALLTGIIMILYIVIAPLFYRIFFHQYLNAVHYSQVFILSLISLPASLLSTVFQAKMMKKELYLLRIVGFVRLFLYAVLIPLYGIWGLIGAKVGAEFFGLSFTLFLFRKF